MIIQIIFVSQVSALCIMIDISALMFIIIIITAVIAIVMM